MFWNKQRDLFEYCNRLADAVVESSKKTKALESKVDLILKHLKLHYVPEKETKEPAKLEGLTTFAVRLPQDFGIFGDGVCDSNCGVAVKPKRKYTKRKK